MKKIVPFTNVLEFNTDVFEITAISLEHKIEDVKDMISGDFFITGEYKITSAQLEKESFSFELPFSIALGSNYDISTLKIDIDDFRYELIDNNKLKVNIDLYIDGNILEAVDEIGEDEKNDIEEINDVRGNNDSIKEEEKTTLLVEDNDLQRRILDDKEEDLDNKEEKLNEKNENSINVLADFLTDSNYVTYRVYRVIEGDNIDKILEKYHITKGELELYNDIENIKVGDKLIIPANDK